MREIKFRGLNFGGVWYYSDKSSLSEFFLLVEAKDSSPIIIKHTIGQYTGLKDKNGKEIYEGDIFQCKEREVGKRDMIGEVYFSEGGFRIKYKYLNPKEGERNDYFLNNSIGGDSAERIEVIGNIYENPELIGGTK